MLERIIITAMLPPGNHKCNFRENFILPCLGQADTILK